jgi:hypothetical protein
MSHDLNKIWKVWFGGIDENKSNYVAQTFQSRLGLAWAVRPWYAREAPATRRCRYRRRRLQQWCRPTTFAHQATPLHAHILVASSASTPCDLRLLDLRSYAAHGDVASAHHVLDQAPCPLSPLLYIALIRAHARRLDLPAALLLFARMRRSTMPPDAHTFSFIVRACADCSRPDVVRVIHNVMLCFGAFSHPVVGCVLANYAQRLFQIL